MNTYSYSSHPHAAPAPGKKHYRPTSDPLSTLTLMSDPRVVRGNTHSLALKMSKAKAELSKSATNIPTRGQIETTFECQPTYQYEVKSFTNNEIDSNLYLVAKDDLPVKTKEVDSQTNEFLKAPSEGEYIPRKTGVDRATQVEDVNDLFSFDVEVEPMLEVIVEKTITQALYEVQTEEEITSLQVAVQEFKHIQQEEALWIKTLEEKAIAEDRRMRDLINSREDAKEQELQSLKTIAGLQMMKQVLPSIIESVIIEKFADKGPSGWRDPVRIQGERKVLPIFVKGTTETLDKYTAANAVVDGLLSDAEKLYHTRLEIPRPSVDRSIKLNITFSRPLEAVDDSEEALTTKAQEFTLLSIQVTSEDSIDSIERKIKSDVAKLKAPPPGREGGDDGDEAATAQQTPTVLVLPDLMTPLDLKSHLNVLLLQIMGPPARDIASDARLLNFPIPDVVDVKIIVPQA